MTRLVAALALAVSVLLALGSTASADAGDYYHPQGSECGQYHGAFEYYRGTRGDWIPGEAQQGGIGDTTGPANSAKGCQSHF
jgi:hypothetical protein